MTNIPVIELKRTIDALLDWVADDYTNATDKAKSWIYRVFNGISIDNYDFYVQAVDLITRTEESPRKLESRVAYDRDRATMPTIFINMNGDRLDGINSIGQNIKTPYYENEDGSYSLSYARCFSANYELLITSSNTYTTQLIYELVECLFQAAIDTLNVSYENITFGGGKDLMINRGIIPNGTFMKSLTVGITYKREVPSIATLEGASNVEFDQSMTE